LALVFFYLLARQLVDRRLSLWALLLAALTVDVLDGFNKPLLIDVLNGGSLQAIDPISHTTISLRANLSTTDPRVTPILKNWRVDYVFACASQPVSGQQ
jgi:hypothetical protein